MGRRIQYNQSMKELAELLNEMQKLGVILDYALFGAVAQMRYTEPVATLDADVLVALPSMDRLDVRHGLAEEWRRFENRFLNE